MCFSRVIYTYRRRNAAPKGTPSTVTATAGSCTVLHHTWSRQRPLYLPTSIYYRELFQAHLITLGSHAVLLLHRFNEMCGLRYMFYCPIVPSPPTYTGHADAAEPFYLSPSPTLVPYTVVEPLGTLGRPCSGKLCITNHYPHCHCPIPIDINSPTARASGIA